MKNFKDLSEREILALAISLEEEDERVYADFFEGLRPDYSASSAVFDSMRKEETEHRRRLIELYQQEFGEHIPLIRRQDVKGSTGGCSIGNEPHHYWMVLILACDSTVLAGRSFVDNSTNGKNIEKTVALRPARCVLQT
jgi:hypothetical protein